MLYFFAVKRGERCPGLKDYRTRACLQTRWGGRYPKTRSQWRWRTSPASLHCKGRTSLRSQFHSMLSSTRRTLQDFHQQASKQANMVMYVASSQIPLVICIWVSLMAHPTGLPSDTPTQIQYSTGLV